MKRHLLVAEFLRTPWAMMPEHLTATATVLASWMAGKSAGPAAMDDEDGKPRISAFEAARAQAQARAGNGAIAVLPLQGSIMQRANMVTEYCGGTSTQQFSQALRSALADDTVGAILIDCDSPGGSVYGVGELADEIYQARNTKPIYGISNSLSASAGYWLLSQCTEVYVTPGGEVGSIGVWQAHEDWSKAMDEAGVKTTLVSAGQFKVEGNPYEPLGDEASAFMQKRVDEYYGAFTKGVSRGRAQPIGSVRDGMGQGRVLGATDALDQKMVDGIATFDDVVRKLSRDMKVTGRKPGASRLARAKRQLQTI